MRQQNCIVDLLMYRIRELGFVLGKCERTCFQASSILAGQGQELITIFSKFFHEILQEWIKYSIFGFEMKWKLWNVCSEGGSRCGALCLYQGAVPRYHWESTPPQREYWHQKVFKNELKSWEQSRNCYIEPHKINIWTFSALTFTTKYPINFPFRRRCLEKNLCYYNFSNSNLRGNNENTGFVLFISIFFLKSTCHSSLCSKWEYFGSGGTQVKLSGNATATPLRQSSGKLTKKIRHAKAFGIVVWWFFFFIYLYGCIHCLLPR